MAVSVLGAAGFNYGRTNDFTIVDGTSRMAFAFLTFETAASGGMPTVTSTLGGESLTDFATITTAKGSSMEQVVRIFLADQSLLTTIGTGTKSLVFDVTGGDFPQGYQEHLVQFEGASQSTPSAPVTTWNDSTDAAPSVNVSVTSTGAALVGASSNNYTGSAPTPGTGFTAIYAGSDSSGDNSGITEYKLSVSAGTNAVSITTGGSTATLVSLGGFVVEPLSGGGSIVPHSRFMLTGIG